MRLLAWQKFGNGETPENSGKKGDHLIGDYYVRFDVEYKAQIKELMAQGMDEETAKKEAHSSKKHKPCSSSGSKTTLRFVPCGKR